MTTPLDVLLIESHPGAGQASAAFLTVAGHRVHRCHDLGDSGYACVGLSADRQCPIDAHVDAAVLVRANGTTAPTPHEDGVRCAVRADVPVVEVGDGSADPYAAWVTLRTEERSVTAACHAAVALARQPLVDAVLAKIAPIAREAGLDPDRLECSITVRWPDMDVSIVLPGPSDRRTEQAIGVRAYDALRSSTSQYRTVNVNVGSLEADR